VLSSTKGRALMGLRVAIHRGGLKRRLRLASLFLLVFLAYHLAGAILGPPLLGWPTTAGEERREFCLSEAEHFAHCVHGR